MLNWKNNFSPRSDNRNIGTMAALMHSLRDQTAALAFQEEVCQSPETFAVWKNKVILQLKNRLQMPPFTEEDPPVLLSSSPREGYTLERWEFYPDPYSAVPVLILRPDGLKEKVPGVLCCPGSVASKELLAGEPVPENANMRRYKFPDRNCQALHCVKNGYIAAAIDNPGMGETAERADDNEETQGRSRLKLVQGLINSGRNYLGLSVFQKLRFLEHFRKMPGVDPARLGIMGHSLGSECALCTALLDEGIKVLIYNDFVCDSRRRYVAVTELKNEEIRDDGSWHFVPGMWQDFGFQDLLAAFAPKFLAINEGGAEEFLNTVRKSYEGNHVPERLQIHYYPKFADREKVQKNLPLYGLDHDGFYLLYSAVDAPDHSFRPEAAVAMLKKAFAQQEKEN